MTTRRVPPILTVGMLLLGFVFGSCSDLKQNIPPPTAPPGVHGPGWASPASSQFHGSYLKGKDFDNSSCAPCHGGDFLGGTSGVSCYGCHELYPHAQGWLDPASGNFHGKVVAEDSVAACTSCHGTDLSGGSSGVSCYACHSSYPHPDGWTNPASSSFHGTVLKGVDYNASQCQACHGSDYQGGSSGVSCYSCHASYPHKTDWTNPASPGFHGTVLKQNNWDATQCTSCHGSDFQGGTSGVSCYTCHSSYPHTTDWTNPAAPGFHGTILKQNNWDATQCTSCHGADFKGGTSGVSCYACHASYPHNSNWTVGTSTESHGRYLKGKNWTDTECTSCHGSSYEGGTAGVPCFACHASYPHSATFAASGHDGYMRTAYAFPLPSCQVCHGSTYAGGPVVTRSCMTAGCHVDQTGATKSPEACNTCHGQFSAPATDNIAAAPPKSVSGQTATNVPAVGAHAAHLASGGTGQAVECNQCHTVPAIWSEPGHIDAAPARVAFGSLATQPTANGTYIPANVAYSFSTNQCGNTYCHGNWRATKSSAPVAVQFAYSDSVMVGDNFSPLWTGGSAEAACGTTCHALPPKGHNPGFTDCTGCHPFNSTTHINGKINSNFQPERPF